MIGETAPLQVSSEWQLIQLINWYEDPIVIAGPQPAGSQTRPLCAFEPVAGRRGCAGGVEIKLQELRCGSEATDVNHRTEGVSYFVVEKGSYLTDEEALWMAGPWTSLVLLADEYTAVTYPETFPPTGPAVFSAVMTNNDANFVKSRQRRGSDVHQASATRAADAYSEFSIKLSQHEGDPSTNLRQLPGWHSKSLAKSHYKALRSVEYPACQRPRRRLQPGARDECQGVRHDLYEITWQSLRVPPQFLRPSPLSTVRTVPL